MDEKGKALVGILLSLLLLASIILRDAWILGESSDVVFLTSFFVYVLLLPWVTGDREEKTFILLIGAMVLMAPAMDTLFSQPGAPDNWEFGFSVVDFLLLSGSGILYYHALLGISRKTKIEAFRIQGFLYLIATVGSVTLLGILGWVGWVLGVPVSHILHYRAVGGK
ncbi:hypothetical protein [Thermococcus gorgonarius]|uniref:Uncharacterized protein n=1 Tax=Thermococcus gorgonarius TaxID=71997 RepID=A0A2Z2M566_THEGO|nr:hypothetical protein [Thermococcus gorgonarius]ASJ00586.1 hypothetical protein A3K92_03400 [Thermococcus gorgonarius]